MFISKTFIKHCYNSCMYCLRNIKNNRNDWRNNRNEFHYSVQYVLLLLFVIHKISFIATNNCRELIIKKNSFYVRQLLKDKCQSWTTIENWVKEDLWTSTVWKKKAILWHYFLFFCLFKWYIAKIFFTSHWEFYWNIVKKLSFVFMNW